MELIEGRGSVVDPHTVQVELPNGESKKFSAKYILLATGGRAFIPDIPGKVYYLLACHQKPIFVWMPKIL